MNEGIAKALRRQARADGTHPVVRGRGTVIPGKETKKLWASLNHRERGQWRAKLPATRAKIRAQTRQLRRIFVQRFGAHIEYARGSVRYMDGI